MQRKLPATRSTARKSIKRSVPLVTVPMGQGGKSAGSIVDRSYLALVSDQYLRTDGDSRAAGTWRAGLARECAWQTHVRAGSHRRSRLAGRRGVPLTRPNPTQIRRTCSIRSITMSTDSTISRRALFMKIRNSIQRFGRHGACRSDCSIPPVPDYPWTRERLSLVGIARFRQPIPGRRNAPCHVSESVYNTDGRQDRRHCMLGKARRRSAISDFRH